MLVAEACLCFCGSEPHRDLAGELFVFGVCSVQCRAGAGAGRGREHLQRMDLCGFRSAFVSPLLILLCKLCCGTLQPCSSVHWFITNHP